jgi:hypothetical protein
MDAVKPLYERIVDLYLKSAELMPEADYGFKPTETVRTFGQLLGHIANEHYIFCSAVLGEKDPNTSDYEKAPHPSFVDSERTAEWAQTEQDRYRLRVDLPDAITPDDEISSEVQAESIQSIHASRAGTRKTPPTRKCRRSNSSNSPGAGSAFTRILSTNSGVWFPVKYSCLGAQSLHRTLPFGHKN